MTAWYYSVDQMGAAQSNPDAWDAPGVPGSYPGRNDMRTAQRSQAQAGPFTHTQTSMPTATATPTGLSISSSSSSSHIRREPTPASTPNIFVSALSYFLPVVPADLTHSHEPPHPTTIRLMSIYLSRLLPPELVPRILDHAEQWAVCTREMRRFVKISAGAFPPRQRFGPGASWDNGQEGEEGIAQALNLGEEGGLKEGDGTCWILVSEPVGCVEKRHAEKIRAGMERDKAEKAGEKVEQRSEVGESEDDTWEKVRRVGSDGLSEGEGEQEEPKAKGWLRRVKIHTLSRDQGWSSSGQQFYGTYQGSYTWFEVSLLRDGIEVPGSRLEIQHNVHAGQYFKDHWNELGPETDFVRMSKPGDRVVLWARALFPGWQNNVREASISIFTSAFPPGQ